MWSKKEWVIFCAGAQTFHTVSHVLIGMTMTFPIQFYSFLFTQTLNIYTTIINAIGTVLLLWWAHKL